LVGIGRCYTSLLLPRNRLRTTMRSPTCGRGAVSQKRKVTHVSERGGRLSHPCIQSRSRMTRGRAPPPRGGRMYSPTGRPPKHPNCARRAMRFAKSSAGRPICPQVIELFIRQPAYPLFIKRAKSAHRAPRCCDRDAHGRPPQPPRLQPPGRARSAPAGTGRAEAKPTSPARPLTRPDQP
jgi:hypothetical protein